jgi:hypothetical protein
MTKKTLSIIAVLLILFFATGILLGTKLGSEAPSSTPADQTNSYQAGWDAAKKQLAEKGMATPPGMEIKSINGTIDTITGNKISLRNVSSMELLSDPSLNSRTIQISSETKIYQLTQKDPAQFQKEMSDFQKKMQEQTADGSQPTKPLDPPYSTDRKEITLAELKSGQQIMVTSDENIGDKKEFTAKAINIQPEIKQINPSDLSITSTTPAPPIPLSSDSQTKTAPPMPASTTPSVPVPPIK